MDIAETRPPRGVAWLRLGFRPFFLAAGLFAVVSMLLWYAALSLHWSLPFAGIGAVTWHAHEMIYGYAMAVIAGFLLTAVGNWTGLPMLRGGPLLLLLVTWLLARVLLISASPDLLPAAALVDLLFCAGLMVAIAVPIVRGRSWGNLPLLAKLALLLASNLVFYLGAAGKLEQGIYWGLYSGLYLVLALVLMMSRRVLPFFIERGVGYALQLRNSRWIDIGSLVLLLVFWIADLVRPNGLLVALTAGGLALLHGIRLQGWYTPGIWKKPLLWSLYLAYAGVVAGFVLKAAVYVSGLSPNLALHAFAVGGIGLMTLGMMARVALGHTGRDVFNPPRILGGLFAIMITAILVRVLLPLLFAVHYALWISLSQWLWITAFSGFLLVYVPVLTRGRVDGADG